jgi:4-aminobutyrate aminotransferase
LSALQQLVGGNALEATPPMIISESEVERAAAILVQAIADAAAGAVSDDEAAPHA